MGTNRDLDSQMLGGCSSFVMVSVGGYVLSAWPFFVWSDMHLASQLAMNCGFGLVPAGILGIIATRRWRIPGATGFVGGALATALFVGLRMAQVALLAQSERTPPLDYPGILNVMIPLGWVLLSTFLAIAALPKDAT